MPLRALPLHFTFGSGPVPKMYYMYCTGVHYYSCCLEAFAKAPRFRQKRTASHYQHFELNKTNAFLHAKLLPVPVCGLLCLVIRPHPMVVPCFEATRSDACVVSTPGAHDKKTRRLCPSGIGRRRRHHMPRGCRFCLSRRRDSEEEAVGVEICSHVAAARRDALVDLDPAAHDSPAWPDLPAPAPGRRLLRCEACTQTLDAVREWAHQVGQRRGQILW